MPIAPLPCQTHDPDLWFPVGISGPALLQTEQAKAYCDICPIKAACLDHALRTHQMDGIWGGKTEAERRLILATTPRRLNEGRTDLVRELASA